MVSKLTQLFRTKIVVNVSIESKTNEHSRKCHSVTPVILQAVQDNLEQLLAQVLADTGHKAEAVFEALAASGCDLVVALGREGNRQLRFDFES